MSSDLITADPLFARRNVSLETGEVILRKCHAALSTQRSGELYLTTKRLIWLPHRLQYPWARSQVIIIPLEDVRTVEVASALWIYELRLKAKGGTFGFVLYKWCAPVVGWSKLTKSWVSAIEELLPTNRPANGNQLARSTRDPTRSLVFIGAGTGLGPVSVLLIWATTLPVEMALALLWFSVSLAAVGFYAYYWGNE